MKSSAALSLVICLALACQIGPVAFGDKVTPGIEELYRLDQMAMFRESVEVGSISSYDRTGGNNDGFEGTYSFVRKEEGGLVLADLKGPGVIYRIWTPTPTDDVMEFYFDGEDEPRITVGFRDLFLGEHPAFERPLVGCGAGGFFSYVPLAYEESCKVVIRAEKVLFYQINYARYPEGRGIQSYSAKPSPEYRRHLEKAKTLFASFGSDVSASVVPPKAEVETIRATAILKPGARTTVFETDRPGRIVGLRFKPANAFAGKDRSVILKAYWDGDHEPAILSPAGDFFGYAWGKPATRSLLVGTAGDLNYCYFPMPFDQSARIDLVAGSRMDAEQTVEAEILFVPVARRPNEGKFYALWRRENPTTKGRPFTFIETKGRGHLVGCIQQSQGSEPGQTGYFEGDDRTIIDGTLAIHGTGSEDFYNGGWYDVPGRWESRQSFVLSGCLGYDKPLGRTGGYRIMLGDAYAYRESIQQTIEHAPTGNDMINDYCGLTYLYSKDRPTCEFSLPEAAARSVVDPERIVFALSWNTPIYAFSIRNATLTKREEQIGGRDLRHLSMQAGREEEWFGPHHICFTCDLPAGGKHRITLDALRGPDQAILQLFQNEVPVGPKIDLFAETRQTLDGAYVGTLELNEGANNLLFKIVGSKSGSEHLQCDLRNLVFERID